jgi:hypothetical protein
MQGLDLDLVDHVEHLWDPARGARRGPRLDMAAECAAKRYRANLVSRNGDPPSIPDQTVGRDSGPHVSLKLSHIAHGRSL